MQKILIANRGEIACRIERTARALGYRTVAVYSDADRDAPHVHGADEAVRIGGAPAIESYLRGDAILAAAEASEADAIHPGYGFLSENAAFARACEDAGLVFIGPPSTAIAAMGDKASAKRRMIAAGVPCVPGYLGDDQGALLLEAERLGYPLLVKAVAGGGGRGMRLVHEAAQLSQALAGARREAEAAFGDGTLMLERLVEDGHHIEVQIFADSHGHVVHLGERDCTAQRRRQKVIEESPSPIVTPSLREAMGQHAIAAARAVDYRGAGTVEFIVDSSRAYYFLEMNTRLQVEHPVTELVTGFDLVEWQLRVAEGEPLPVEQADIRMRGHAIEARLYAEDPYKGFLPQTGRIRYWRPRLAGVRVDDGIVEGSDLGPFYDPMVAKIIAHGADRPDAIRRLAAALAASPLVGVVNNAPFLRDLVRHDDFASATLTTGTLDQWLESGAPIFERPRPSDRDFILAAAARVLRGGAGWRSASVAASSITLRCDDDTRSLRVEVLREGEVRVGDETCTLRIVDDRVTYDIAGVQRRAVLVDDGVELCLSRDAATFVFTEPSPWPAGSRGDDGLRVHASVAGVVSQLPARVGARVTADDELVCIEAMKMEMWSRARIAGVVSAVHVGLRDQVEAGALLVELSKDEVT